MSSVWLDMTPAEQWDRVVKLETKNHELAVMLSRALDEASHAMYCAADARALLADIEEEGT